VAAITTILMNTTATIIVLVMEVAVEKKNHVAHVPAWYYGACFVP